MANIFKKAKSVQRNHPSWDWQKCIQFASKHNKPAKKKTAYKQRGTSNKKRDIVRKAKPPGKRKSASGRTYTETRKNRSDAKGSLTGVTASSLVSELKKRLNADIDKQVLRKYHATRKTDKRKIQKAITQKKAQLRRIA